MRSSMPRRWTSRSSALIAAAFCAAAPLLADGTFPDPVPHVARTDAEAARVARVTAPSTDFSAPEPYEARPAGAATVAVRSDALALDQPSANMSRKRQIEFVAGKAMFDKIWVQAPTVTKASDGLGPFYNARGCQNCHLNAGRGHLPADSADSAISFVLALAVGAEKDTNLAEIADYFATAPEPTYGRQIQDYASSGLTSEAVLSFDWTEQEVSLAGGEVVTLRKPNVSPANLAYGPLAEGTMTSPRIAPQLVGLGLLEAIPAADILAHVDEDDADRDGISGRANMVWSPEHQRVMLGRFGRKASSVTVAHETAAAFSTDLGISTPMFPDAWGDCSPAQSACRAAPHGDDAVHDGAEASQVGLDITAFYARHLGVPARRNPGSAEVLRGKQVFYEAGCVACHVPKFVTHRTEARPEHSFQLIWPYTDLLLHDMGEGLADGFTEGRATGREWRTPPLWGIGLTKQVSGVEAYMHDGRARTLLEAVLWHGGEAQAARDDIIARPKPDRDALVTFLESL